MKKLIAFVVLLPSMALSADRTYKLVQIEPIFDSSYGTVDYIVNGSTITDGWLVGCSYKVEVQEPGIFRHEFFGELKIIPRNTLPTKAQILTTIKNDAIANGIVAQANEAAVRAGVMRRRRRIDGLFNEDGEEFQP